MLDHMIFSRFKWFKLTNDSGSLNRDLIPISGTIMAGSIVNGGGGKAPQDTDVRITGFLRKGADLGHKEYAGGNLPYDAYTIEPNSSLNTSSTWIPVTSFKNVKWGG